MTGDRLKVRRVVRLARLILPIVVAERRDLRWRMRERRLYLRSVGFGKSFFLPAK